jgi:predicted Zn-dependent protease
MTGQAADPDEATALAIACRRAAASAPVAPGADLVAGPHESDFDAEPSVLPNATTEQVTAAVRTWLAQPNPQFGYAEVDRTTTYLATTAGTRVRRVQDDVRIEASMRDGAGSTWWGTNALGADFALAAEHSAERLAIQRHRVDIQAGRQPVILSPSAVADLLIYLAWSANGRDAVEGHNVFSRPGGGTRLGEVLTHRRMDLFADPAYPGLPTSDRAFVEADSAMESVFDNGLPLGTSRLIRDGRVHSLRASRPTASRFGLAPVYLADNLILTDAGGTGTVEDLVARTEDALLVTCLWYIREVDPQNLLLTGLTRDGVYVVRDGRITGAAPNFRFNVSVTDLLGQVTDASRTVQCLPREWADWFTRAAMPALLVDRFNLSSPSEAL